MSNCETCRDKDWCSSEEMDRNECPVRSEGDSNVYVNAGEMYSSADYGRAIVLYQHHVMTRQEFVRITNTISEVFISAIEGIKAGDDNA